MTLLFSDFTVLTVSIGYNHFLEKWAECVAKLQNKPSSVIVGVDFIEEELKKRIETYLPEIIWVNLIKVNLRHHGHYYNKLIDLVNTTWVCKIDADDQILPDAYNDLGNVEADIYAFGNISSLTGVKSFPDPGLSAERILFGDNNLLSSLSPFKKRVWEANIFKDFIFDDWIFWIDAAKNDFTFSTSNKVNYIYVEHFSQATKNSDEKYERSISLIYKRDATKYYLDNSELCSFGSYLFVPPPHSNFRIYSDMFEILGRIHDAGKSKIYILDFSLFCQYPLLDSNLTNNKCTICESLILNLQNNFNFNLVVVDVSFYSKSEYIFDFVNNSRSFQKFLNSHDIDCVVNTRFTNISHLFDAKIISILSLNDSLSVDSGTKSHSYFDFDFKTKYLTKSVRLYKYFSYNNLGHVLLKNIDILTNLPVDHLLEFNKINLGYTQALSFLEKKASQSIISGLINKLKVKVKRLK